MRLLHLLLCTLLLAAPTFGQSSPVAPASPSTGDPQAGQTPQSPLQEPQKPTEAEANRPKPASFDVSNAAVTAEDQNLGEFHLMSRYTQLNGDLSRSFREPGSNNLAEFNYFFDHGLAGTRRFQALSMYRGTDDRSIDPERNSLQKAYLRLYGPRDEYILGDALVNFSRLSFNQNVKGLATTWKMGQDWKLSGFGGIFIDRYGSLYKPYSSLPGRPYMSWVQGARLEYKFARDSALGFNFSRSDDKQSSLPVYDASGNLIQPGTSPLPATNNVGTVDLKLQRAGIRFESEYAYSFTDFDYRSDTGCAGLDTRVPQPTCGTQDDWAARAEGSWRLGKLSMRGSYMRFQPNFASMTARQIADLQDIVFRTSVDVTDWMMLDGTIRRSNNDLRGQQRNPLPGQQAGFQTVLLGPEGRLVLHELPFYRRATMEFGYRHRDVSASNGSIDRFVRSPYAELTLPAGSTFFTIGFEHRMAYDYKDPSQTSNTDRPYVSLRGVYDLGGWHFNPMLRFELERQKIYDVTDIDSNRLSSLGLFIEAPKWFIMELAYRDSSAIISNPLPAGFNRPSYRGALTYKFRNDENTIFVFSFERNHNFYDAMQNFDERIVGVSFVYKFGRRGGR